jgi:hypothetical protein
MTTNSLRFELFRYQLLPQDRFIQEDMLVKHEPLEKILARKNQIFGEALDAINEFRSNRTELATQKLWAVDNVYAFKVAADRSLNRETREFKKETLENWPSVLVLFANDPKQQLIAVQKRTNAFQHPKSVVKLVLDSLAPSLATYTLSVRWEPLFERSVFWDLIERYKKRIHEIEFEWSPQTWPTYRRFSRRT